MRVRAKLLQLCSTVCNPMNHSSPGSSVRGFLQAKILEWVAFPFPGTLPNPGIKSGSPPLQADSLLSEAPGKPKNTGVYPMPSPGDLPDSGIEPGSPVLQVDSLPAELLGKPKCVSCSVAFLFWFQ